MKHPQSPISVVRDDFQNVHISNDSCESVCFEDSNISDINTTTQNKIVNVDSDTVSPHNLKNPDHTQWQSHILFERTNVVAGASIVLYWVTYYSAYAASRMVPLKSQGILPIYCSRMYCHFIEFILASLVLHFTRKSGCVAKNVRSGMETSYNQSLFAYLISPRSTLSNVLESSRLKCGVRTVFPVFIMSNAVNWYQHFMFLKLPVFSFLRLEKIGHALTVVVLAIFLSSVLPWSGLRSQKRQSCLTTCTSNTTLLGIWFCVLVVCVGTYMVTNVHEKIWTLCLYELPESIVYALSIVQLRKMLVDPSPTSALNGCVWAFTFYNSILHLLLYTPLVFMFEIRTLHVTFQSNGVMHLLLCRSFLLLFQAGASMAMNIQLKSTILPMSHALSVVMFWCAFDFATKWSYMSKNAVLGYCVMIIGCMLYGFITVTSPLPYYIQTNKRLTRDQNKSRSRMQTDCHIDEVNLEAGHHSQSIKHW